ncbi:MAG: TIGR03936 family radical SAM-associated protein [Anaerolineales bacterium]
MTESQRHRYRITFAKTDPMRFTGHLDLHHAWERMLRRAGVPLAYTRGHKPRARLSLGLALPLGFTSECEWIDVWFEVPQEPDALLQSLQRAAPPGLQLISIETVESHQPALQKQILAATYEVELPSGTEQNQVVNQIDELLQHDDLPRQRRGKSYDLRPLIEILELTSAEASTVKLIMRLAAREGATGRPEEVLLSLGLDPAECRIQRTEIHLIETQNHKPEPN